MEDAGIRRRPQLWVMLRIYTCRIICMSCLHNHVIPPIIPSRLPAVKLTGIWHQQIVLLLLSQAVSEHVSWPLTTQAPKAQSWALSESATEIWWSVHETAHEVLSRKHSQDCLQHWVIQWNRYPGWPWHWTTCWGCCHAAWLGPLPAACAAKPVSVPWQQQRSQLHPEGCPRTRS